MGKFKKAIQTFAFVTVLGLGTLSFMGEAFAVTLTSPTGNGRQTSEFGMRDLHGDGDVRRHTGSDFGPNTPGVAGDPIYASTSGTVIRAGPANGYGNYVVIQYPDGSISTAYGHMNSIGVSVGDTVSAGQQIGTMGNTGRSTAVHLHYEVMVKDPATGQMVFVDPALAAGQDLNDPAVVAALIADANAKMNGNAAANVANTGAGGAASAAPSCSNDMLETGKQLKEASMNLEKGIIDQMVQKPPSVMEMSCFDQFGQMFKQEIGGIFSDIDSTFQPLKSAFPGIFEDAQSSFLGEISGSLFGDRANSFGSTISSQVSSALSSILGGGSNVNYGCDVMNTLWKMLQCEDIFNFNIPSLKDLIGGSGFMQDILPSSCSGKALYDGALQAAQKAFTDNGNASSGLSPVAIDQLLRSW